MLGTEGVKTMADKEERIEVSTYDLNNKEWNGDIPIDILKVYTRQEAIETIKKSLKKIQCWPDSFNDSIAETALNALLAEALNVKDDE